MPQLLTDDELAAYQQHATAENNWPLAAIMAELRDRRAAPGIRVAIVILPPGATILPYVAAQTAPALIVAPQGTRLTKLQVAAGCVLESYDPAHPLELRQILRGNGISA